MKNSLGFSALELLIVTAIIGVVFGLAVISGRNTAQSSTEQSAIRSIQQLIWQGATGAAARGVEVRLNRSGDLFTLERVDTNEVIRSFSLPDGVSLNLSNGQVLLFTPPGKISTASFQALPDPITISTSKESHTLLISIIGEVKVQ